MSYIKTLTINGNSYTIRDAEATHIDDTAIGADAWSSKNIVDRLCPAFSESGGAVVCEPVDGYPLGVVFGIDPVQSGSGDPSPDNIRPISGRDTLTLYNAGKNLLNNTAVTTTTKGVTFTVADDGSIIANGKATDDIFFEVGTAQLIAGQTYIMSGCPRGGNASTAYSFYCSHDGYYYDTGIGAAFTAIANKSNIFRILIKSGVTISNQVFRPMVRLASVADNTYEKYAAGSTSISVELGQTVYGGSYDWNSGVLTVDRAMYTVTGEELIAEDDSVTDHMFLVFHDLENMSLFNPCVCSHFLGTESEAANGIKEEAVSAFTPAFAFNSAILAAEGAAEYFQRQYAAGTPVSVVYTLERPITVQLTPRQVLALDGCNTLFGSTGDVTVTGRTDPTAVIEKLTKAIISMGGNI